MNPSLIPHYLILILIAVAVTFFLRAVPFLLFGGKREMPPAFKKVADALPPAIIAVLVIYCLKDNLCGGDSVTLIAGLISVAAVAVLHVWKRNTLLSVFAGTALYMILLRVL